MARLFDAYIIADWTAAEGKKLGDTSLWLGVAKRDVRFRLYTETHNVATRAEGEALLASLLAEHRKRGDRVLVGFDFNFGFPAGTAARLKLTGTPWSAMWKFLASNVVDKPDNTNNRYQVAAKINRLMTDNAWPMWGAPANQAQRWLTTTKPPAGSGADIPEYRATQDAVRKGKLQPKSVWQMHGAGAVGGQTLVGVPAVRRLLEKLGPSGAVWPFGTGWRALDAADVEPLSALVVEVYPSMFDAKPNEGEFKDQAQVRVTAEHFAALDEAGTLSAAFAPPKGASEALIAKVEQEEGWILGGLTAGAPLIIAHRGASGERPEHTRAAYELAIEQGADFIEPDLVMTADGVLIVRHENEISGTTDVASHPEFADRHTTKTIDGAAVTGWFAEDFTLAELETLRARERLPDLRPANTAFDGREPVLTLDEVLDIAAAAGVGVAPELKHPSYFAGLGLPMEDVFVATLERCGLTGADAPILIQCFETGTLQRLRARIAAPLLHLIAASGGPFDRPDLSYAAMTTPEGLADIARYADWIGPDTSLIEPTPRAATALITHAHAAGLKVAAWTFRAENAFLPEADRIGDDPAGHGRLRGRLARFAGYGLDAAFMDQPALGR